MTHEPESQVSHESDERGHVEAAQALAAAAMQIELALREGQAPVDRLGFLVDGMSEAIRELRATEAAALAVSALEPAGCDETLPPVERLQKDLFLFITQLQFYDRLVQHLTHLQDFLAGVANELGTPTASNRDVWDELRVKLRKRLISAAQRELLDVTLTPPTGVSMTSAEARAEYASAGSAELF